MNNPDFNTYVLEYQSEGIGILLYTFIGDIVVRVSRRYPAAVYSPNGIWDEDAISAFCNDFIIEKLIKAGWLEHYLVSLETVEQLRLALQRDFKHFLINRRKRDEIQNLMIRLKRLLSTSPTFKRWSSVANIQVWGLSEWKSQEQVQQLDEVVRAMYQVVLPPLTRYSATSRKVSHLISNEDLERLLTVTLRQLNRYASFELLGQAIRYRLNLLEVDPISLDEPLNPVEDESATYAEVIPSSNIVNDIEIVEIANHIVNQLSQRQKRTLSTYLSLEKPTLEKVGREIGISKSAVDNDLKIIQQYVEAAQLTEQQAEALFSQLSELCAEQA